jgi:hypothetical protein
MLRFVSFLCFGGGFLIISPSLRESINLGLAKAALKMDLYAPWSYVGGAVVLLMALIFSLYRGAQARQL